MPVPSRNQWKQLKKTYGVPDGAAKGIDFGKELDKIDKASRAGNKDAYVAALKLYVTVAANYIKTVDRKKIKNFDAFQKVFIDDYVGDAHKTLEGVKLEADGRKLYVSELRKFFAAVQKLGTNPTPVSVQKFSQFARGLSSVAKRTNGSVDATAINRELARIDAAKDKVKPNASQRDVQAFIDTALDVAKEIADHAEAQRLIAAKPALR